MKCPACGFENLRGTERCTHCRARLFLPAGGLPAESSGPPRAGRLKSLRWLHYAISLQAERFSLGLRRRVAGHPFTGTADLSADMVATLVLSIIPGLGHIQEFRWRAALVWGGGWLMLAALTVNFYSSATLFYLPALLLNWHVATMTDAARISQRIAGTWTRLRVVMLQIFLPCLLGYSLIHWVATCFADVVPLNFSVPALGTGTGDSLLVRHSLGNAPLRRGMLVFRDERFPGVVLAIAGDQLERVAGGLEVNGQLVPPEMLVGGIALEIALLPANEPLKELFNGKRVTVGPDLIVVGVPFVYGLHTWRQINQLQVWSRHDSLRYATAIWLPVKRRHRFRFTDETIPDPAVSVRPQ